MGMNTLDFKKKILEAHYWASEGEPIKDWLDHDDIISMLELLRGYIEAEGIKFVTEEDEDV